MPRPPDPFADPEVRERAAKLLRLLGSDAAGEADAARVALLRLLARHDASLDDLTQRLLAPTPDDLPTLRGFVIAAERRAALAEAASRSALAETERLRTSATLLRIIAIGGGGIAALLLALVLLPTRGSDHSRGSSVPLALTPASAPPVSAMPAPPQAPKALSAPLPTDRGMSFEEFTGQSPPPVPSPAIPAPTRQPVPATRRGQVIEPEGVLLRLDPVPGVPAVALLPKGTKVIIDQAFPMLGTDWMQVRTSMGSGFVPASTIGPE